MPQNRPIAAVVAVAAAGQSIVHLAVGHSTPARRDNSQSQQSITGID